MIASIGNAVADSGFVGPCPFYLTTPTSEADCCDMVRLRQLNFNRDKEDEISLLTSEHAQ